MATAGVVAREVVVGRWRRRRRWRRKCEDTGRGRGGGGSIGCGDGKERGGDGGDFLVMSNVETNPSKTSLFSYGIK